MVCVSVLQLVVFSLKIPKKLLKMTAKVYHDYNANENYQEIDSRFL